MKKFSVVGHWPMAIGVLCALSCLSRARVAQAGSWSGPVYQVSGRTPSDNSQSAQSSPSGGAPGDVIPVAEATVSSSGTVKATFTYQPDNADDVPPQYISVREHGVASWGTFDGVVASPTPPPGRGGHGRSVAPSNPSSPSARYTVFQSSHQPRLLLVQSGGSSGTGSADDGLDDDEEATLSPDMPNAHGGVSQGTHFKTYRVTDNQITTDAVTLSAHCTGPQASVSWSYSAQLADHSVYISSDIEKSFKKGTGPLPSAYTKVDAAGHSLYESQQVAGVGTADTADDVWKLECIRNRDGSMTVNSATYMLFGGNYPVWAGRVLLGSNISGFDSPEYDWKLTSGGSLPFGGPTWTNSSYDLRDDGETVVFDNSSLATSIFTLEVTDSGSGYPLDNHYNIEWHYPYEPYHKRPNIYSFIWRNALSQVDDGGYFSLANGDAESQDNPYETEDSSWVPGARAGVGALDLVGLFPEGKDIADIISKLGGKALDWYVEKNFPTKTRHFTNISEAWGYSQQHQQSGNSESEDPSPIGGLVPSDLASNPNGWLKCSHQVFEVVQWRREGWDAEAYNNNGYVAHNGLVSADEALAVTVEVAFERVRP